MQLKSFKDMDLMHLLIVFALGLEITEITKSFTHNLIDPLIGVLVSDNITNLAHYTFVINDSFFNFGLLFLDILHLLIVFIILWVIYRVFKKK